MNTINNKNENENLYQIFKKKAMSTVNKIHLIEDPDHLKEAIKKIDALNAFIDTTSKQSAPNKEFIKVNNDPPNKIITTQKNFFQQNQREKKPENDLFKPSELESNELQNTFLNKKFKIL